MMNQIAETMTRIHRFCVENKIPFRFEREGEDNFVNYTPEKGVMINIGNPNDDGFNDALLETLQNLVK